MRKSHPKKPIQNITCAPCASFHLFAHRPLSHIIPRQYCPFCPEIGAIRRGEARHGKARQGHDGTQPGRPPNRPTTGRCHCAALRCCMLAGPLRPPARNTFLTVPTDGDYYACSQATCQPASQPPSPSVLSIRNPSCPLRGALNGCNLSPSVAVPPRLQLAIHANLQFLDKRCNAKPQCISFLSSLRLNLLTGSLRMHNFFFLSLSCTLEPMSQRPASNNTEARPPGGSNWNCLTPHPAPGPPKAAAVVAAAAAATCISAGVPPPWNASRSRRAPAKLSLVPHHRQSMDKVAIAGIYPRRFRVSSTVISTSTRYP